MDKHESVQPRSHLTLLLADSSQKQITVEMPLSTHSPSNHESAITTSNCKPFHTRTISVRTTKIACKNAAVNIKREP